MNRYVWPLIPALLVLAVSIAVAETNPPTVEQIALHPWIETFRPFVDILVPPTVATFVGLAYAKISTWTGFKMKNDAVERVKSAFATQAGVAVGAAEDNLANKTITVNSKIVADAVNNVSARLPAAIKLSGFTPADLLHVAAGEFGKLQAASPLVVANNPRPS